jgi:hypothetical protein
MRHSFRYFGATCGTPCIVPWHCIADIVNSCKNSESNILQRYLVLDICHFFLICLLRLLFSFNCHFTDYVGCVQYVTDLLQSTKPTKEVTYWRDIGIQNLEYVTYIHNYFFSYHIYTHISIPIIVTFTL